MQLSPTADVLAEWAEILTPDEEKSEVDQEATQVIRQYMQTYTAVARIHSTPQS